MKILSVRVESSITFLAMVTHDKCLHRWFVKLTKSESSKLWRKIVLESLLWLVWNNKQNEPLDRERVSTIASCYSEGIWTYFYSNLSEKDRKVFAGISNSYIILAFWSWTSNKTGRAIELHWIKWGVCTRAVWRCDHWRFLCQAHLDNFKDL